MNDKEVNEELNGRGGGLDWTRMLILNSGEHCKIYFVIVSTMYISHVRTHVAHNTSFAFQFSVSDSWIASIRDALVACQSHSLLFIALNFN